MSQGEILHLFNWDRKFFPPFRKLIHDHFADGRHKFIVYGNVDTAALPVADGAVVYPTLLKNAVSVSKAMHRAEKVILHGLFNNHLLYLLASQPWMLEKCCWVLWGGDLYIHEAKNKSWRWKKDELFRRFVLSRLALLTTTVPGDYRLAQEWYGVKAKYVHNLMYPSHLHRQASPPHDDPGTTLAIQLGNSADPSNNHKEIIDKLAKLQESSGFAVYTPLSYGLASYRDEIVAYGRAKLGERFFPLTEFMSSGQYDKYLEGIDIAIFNHRRQQGMGNTIALLSLGKTVWLRRDVTPWEYLTGIGLSVFDSSGPLTLYRLSQGERQRNIALCTQHFSEAALISAWGEIFHKPFHAFPAGGRAE